MSADLVMNSSGPTVTFLFKFSMTLAMYLYNTLLECSCCVMISVHLVGRLHRGIFRHIFTTTLRSIMMSIIGDFLFLDSGQSKNS